MYKKTLILTVLLFVLFNTYGFARVQIDSVWEMSSKAHQLYADFCVQLTDDLNLNLGIKAFGSMSSAEEFGTEVTSLGLEYQFSPKYQVFGGTVGRNFGRARLYSLLLSPKSPAFPMIGYQISGERYSYTKIYGDLTDYNGESVNKRVGIQYLDWLVHPRLSIGIGEALVRDSSFRGDIYYDLLPFIPYYLAKYLPGISSTADNSLVYGDFELRLDFVTLFGELLVNEFPMGFRYNNNPPLFGLTAGAETDRLLPNWLVLVEYSHMRNYAYANGNLYTSYVYGQQSLGHPLGDDLETLDLRLSRYWPNLQLTTSIGGFYRALGENRELAKWYKDLEHRKETAFLTGVVERTIGTKFGAKYCANPELAISVDFELGHVNNYQHQLNKEGLNVRAVLNLSWQAF